jgi:hypothetical protein
MSRLKFAFIAAIFGTSILAAHAQTSSPTTVTGFLTDTLSGKRGANALHVDSAKRNVAAGMAQYAVYDEKTHKLYILEPQSTATAFVCQRITVTGALAPSPMAHGAQTIDPNTNQVKNFHHLGQDDATPIGGVLTFTSLSVAPAGSAKAATKRTQ